jgi:hypothetical protein
VPSWEREVRSRFDYWIDGGVRDSYFHGWPNHPKYKDCFVFKWKENRRNRRLYGFLAHPTPIADPRFQVYILVSHVFKDEFETDPARLDRAVALRGAPAVAEGVRKAFPGG